VVLIDDSYNANPTSMRASINSLERIDAKRRIAILGDMAELGSYSDGEHRELGAFIARSSIDRLYWLGTNGRHVSEGIGVASKKTVKLFDSLDNLCPAVEADLQTGDVVLVKGSRAASLERVVKYLEQSLGKEDAS
jgi:UDP-N-acetylmuramoyl-tripeptide--D-alanyl-D-alanine ligase